MKKKDPIHPFLSDVTLPATFFGAFCACSFFNIAAAAAASGDPAHMSCSFESTELLRLPASEPFSGCCGAPIHGAPTVPGSLGTSSSSSVPHNKVKVVNAGVCPGGSDGTSEQSTLPFHTLKYADGLAWWQGQIGSFNKQHLYNHFKPLLKSAKPKNRYTWANLEALLTETPVACYTLLGLLRAHGIAKVGMLLLDTEGLDCGILANQEWGSDEWCDRRPTGIVFEFRHCPKEALANASTALSERSGKCRHAGKEHYKRVAANSENEFWALERKREMNAR